MPLRKKVEIKIFFHAPNESFFLFLLLSWLTDQNCKISLFDGTCIISGKIWKFIITSIVQITEGNKGYSIYGI